MTNTPKKPEALAAEKLGDIVDRAVEAGADAITVEFWKEGGLEVMFKFGNVGVGGVFVDRQLQSHVMTLIHERAGLETKPTGQLLWRSHGRDLKIRVEEYEDFGETAYRLKLPKTRK